MDRLTRRINGFVCYTKGKYEDTITAEMETRDVRECLEKLAEYEDIGSVEEIKEIVKKYSTHRENDMKTHEIKTLPEYFQQTLDGNKGFEVRKNDRDYRKGDTVVMEEWNGKEYTGREIHGIIKYVLKDFEGLTDGYVAFSVDIYKIVDR